MDNYESIFSRILKNPNYRRIILLALTIQLLVILFYIILKSKKDLSFLLDETNVLLLTGFLIVLTTIMVLYLQGTRTNSDNNNEDRSSDRMLKEMYMMQREQVDRMRHEMRGLREEFSSQINSLEGLQSIELTDSEKGKLLSIIEDNIQEVVSKNIIDSFEKNYSKTAALRESYKELVDDLRFLQQRLMREISRLSLRGNLNLAIGSTTTIFAILILYITVVNNVPSFEDLNHALSFFIPRISIVIFIEIFSFFFLKLYRSNLGDIKYYQNEMTNADFRILALKSAFAKDDQESIRKIISEFVTMERNFILKKGESTVEIEKARIENASEDKWKDVLVNIFQAKK